MGSSIENGQQDTGWPAGGKETGFCSSPGGSNLICQKSLNLLAVKCVQTRTFHFDHKSKNATPDSSCSRFLA